MSSVTPSPAAPSRGQVLLHLHLRAEAAPGSGQSPADRRGEAAPHRREAPGEEHRRDRCLDGRRQPTERPHQRADDLADRHEYGGQSGDRRHRQVGARDEDVQAGAGAAGLVAEQAEGGGHRCGALGRVAEHVAQGACGVDEEVEPGGQPVLAEGLERAEQFLGLVDQLAEATAGVGLELRPVQGRQVAAVLDRRDQVRCRAGQSARHQPGHVLQAGGHRVVQREPCLLGLLAQQGHRARETLSAGGGDLRGRATLPYGLAEGVEGFGALVGHGDGPGHGGLAHRLLHGGGEVLLGHLVLGAGELADDVPQPLETALRVPCLDAQGLQAVAHLLRRSGEVGHHSAQGGAGRLAEDARLAEHADRGGGVLHAHAQAGGDRTGVPHGVVDVDDAAGGVVRGGRQDVGSAGGLVGAEAELVHDVAQVAGRVCRADAGGGGQLQ